MSSPSAALAAGSRTRILLLVATRRDADVTQRLLHEAGLASLACHSVAQLVREVRAGAGALLLTEEVLASEEVGRLLGVLQQQEEWSDLPIVVLIKGGTDSPRASSVLRLLTNVTVLERPAPMRSVLSAIQAALRARQRQYQIRDQMEAVRRAEVRAQKLQQQLEAALYASNVGTFFVELPPRSIVCDERCRGHLTLPQAGELTFEAVLAVVHSEDRERVEQAARAAGTGDEPLDIEFLISRARTSGAQWVRVQGRVMKPDGDGAAARFVGTTQDVTARRRMEEERTLLLRKEQNARLEAERANRLKDEFLATLSHELRTPLNAIAGWAELLKETPDDVETVTEAGGAISRSVRVQAELIEDLLDVSRIISGKVRLELRPLRLSEVVGAAVETMLPTAENKGVKIETDLDGRLPVLTADPARLQQVVWNLLSNAVKFTAPGGSIRVALRREARVVRLTVTDTGEGIAPEFLPRMFERFSQADGSPSRRHGGLGLGLSIVRGLTEMHGGRVWATSPGKGLGATFHVELPLTTTAEPAERSPPETGVFGAAPERPALDGVSVLVVDDEPDAREVLRRLLVRSGARPLVAASAQEARSLMAEAHPQVIVSDIGMPGTDGYQFVRELRWQKNETPAIALTAFARSEDASRAYAAGYQAHLPKPVDPALLLAQVARLVKADVPNRAARVD